jgi:hypothetical protein
MMRILWIACLSALSLAASGVGARAVLVVPVTLQPGNVEVRAQIDDSIDCSYLGTAVSGCSAANPTDTPEAAVSDGASMAEAEAHISSDPSVNIQVNLDPQDNTTGQALVTTTYQFYVNGTAGDSVNVFVIGAISITDTEASGPVTAGSVYYTLVGPGVSGGQTEFINSNAQVQHILDKYTVLGGDTYTVTLRASVDLNQGTPSCCIATPGQIAKVTANLDPTVTIDPNSPNASAFSLQFSPGFGPSAAPVPEPSTWAMMLVGFGGLAFAARRSARTLMAASSRR